MSRVLIAGGAGYVGSHTAKLLARNGCACVVLDDLSTGHPGAVPRDALVVGDIGDAALLRRVLKTHKTDAVIHLAASAHVAESLREPQKYFHNNVVNSLALLAVDDLRQGGPSHAFNLGAEQGHSVRDVIAAVATAARSTWRAAGPW